MIATTNPKARELYERCAVCGGSAVVPREQLGKSHAARYEPTFDGKVECPACRGERFIKVGLTVADVGRIVAERDAMRAERVAGMKGGVKS